VLAVDRSQVGDADLDDVDTAEKCLEAPPVLGEVADRARATVRIEQDGHARGHRGEQLKQGRCDRFDDDRQGSESKGSAPSE
jgi:hypothetical protein